MRIYLSLIVTNCNEKQSFCKSKTVEWTKGHH